MIKKWILLLAVVFLAIPAFGADNNEIVQEQTVQNKIDDIGTKLLNANKIQKRIMFVYDKADKKSLLKLDTKLTSRRVFLYDGAYKFTENDDEIAAFMAREIVIAAKSFDEAFKGGLNSLEIAASPKKYEVIADKLAVDLMVNAGYNPLGLITYINKTVPQRRYDFISNKNLASKRLAFIYEYIYNKYPYFLVNNEYIENEHYQNFLLNSQSNRRLLMQKIKSGSTEKVKYE